MDKRIVLLSGPTLKVFIKVVEQAERRNSAALMKEMEELLK